MATLGRTGLDVFGICFGGNVFGWTADEPTSRDVLDAYVAAGGNFVDTANSYLKEHGQSEKIIGRWLADRGGREDLVIATKVGGGQQYRNLRPETIEREAHASLERLQIDRIDLYYAHHDDPGTPLEDSLRAFDALVQEGVVAHLAASNYSAARLTEAIEFQRANGLAEFVAWQPHYNLVERETFEAELQPVAERYELAVFPYYALAKGFLTGKYRPGEEAVASERAEGALAYLDARGEAVLAALDEIAASHATTVAAVALAWLRSRETVVAPIASARTVEQLAQILPAATLELGAAELERLDAASA